MKLTYLSFCISILIVLLNHIDSDAKTQEVNDNVNVNPLTKRSLLIWQAKGKEIFGRATGFVVEKNYKKYLVTNWHVVSGKNPYTDKIIDEKGRIPDRILIWHHRKKFGTWETKAEELYSSDGKKLWLEHKNGKDVDLIALPLKNIPDEIQIYPFDLKLTETDMIPEVAMPVSIIGFPLGLTSSGVLPIWKTGHIASEPYINYLGKPLFIIDATTRGGMSGSPVVLRLISGYKTKNGNTVYGSNMRTLFMGVYSGRIDAVKDSGDGESTELGLVWRPYLIDEIIP